MATETIAQILTVLVAVLGIIWHQQRSTEKLRDDFTRAVDGVRDDFTRAVDGVRDDFTKAVDGLREDHNGLRQEVVNNGQRLARIEGFLRIGMPAASDADSSEISAPEAVSPPSATEPEGQ